MGKLVLFRPDGTAQDIKLDRDRVTIGRRPDNDVCLPQAAVSGEHAAVVTILADSFLEDLGSTNGTLVNGKAVTKHFLRDRDEIDIGREILVYLADDSAKADRRRAGASDRRGPRLPMARRPPTRAGRQARRPRSDVPAFSGQSLDAIQRVVAAEIESSALEEPPRAAPTIGAATGARDTVGRARRAVAAAHAGDPRPQRGGRRPVDCALGGGNRRRACRRSGGRAAPVGRRAFGCPDRGCAAARQRRAGSPGWTAACSRGYSGDRRCDARARPYVRCPRMNYAWGGMSHRDRGFFVNTDAYGCAKGAPTQREAPPGESRN